MEMKFGEHRENKNKQKDALFAHCINKLVCFTLFTSRKGTAKFCRINTPGDIWSL